MNKTISAVLKLVCALLMALALFSIQPHSSNAQESDLSTEARKALTVLFDALRSGDPNKVRPLLAPEFQVVRSDGAAYDKEQYLRHSIPKIEGQPSFDELIVTRNADIVVTRMKLKIEERLNERRAESGAPQLIVFHVTPPRLAGCCCGQFCQALGPIALSLSEIKS